MYLTAVQKPPAPLSVLFKAKHVRRVTACADNLREFITETLSLRFELHPIPGDQGTRSQPITAKHDALLNPIPGAGLSAQSMEEAGAMLERVVERVTPPPAHGDKIQRVVTKMRVRARWGGWWSVLLIW